MDFLKKKIEFLLRKKNIFTSGNEKFSKVVFKKYLAADLYRLQFSSARPAAHFALHKIAASSLFYLNIVFDK